MTGDRTRRTIVVSTLLAIEDREITDEKIFRDPGNAPIRRDERTGAEEKNAVVLDNRPG